MDKKMTYIDALNFALETINENTGAMGSDWVDAADEAVTKLTALKEQLTKRNTSKSGKLTKSQRENVAVKDRIREFLTHTLQGVRCGDIAKELDISGQKCSALLRQMKEEGVVVTREGEKRVTLFLLRSTWDELTGASDEGDPDQQTNWERNTMN